MEWIWSPLVKEFINRLRKTPEYKGYKINVMKVCGNQKGRVFPLPDYYVEVPSPTIEGETIRFNRWHAIFVTPPSYREFIRYVRTRHVLFKPLWVPDYPEEGYIAVLHLMKIEEEKKLIIAYTHMSRENWEDLIEHPPTLLIFMPARPSEPEFMIADRVARILSTLIMTGIPPPPRIAFLGVMTYPREILKKGKS